ncbi:hypothetical protein BBO99_00000176 [Phytophthora kernoviae]|uniref:Uncharacterized protein n=1 Tax=Phytophthora kernoviae TaxID=325452 RepID=A0A3F2S3W1_9STRA|nr:hypothetical protein BBI17_000278 [Phytophthora kernoviae]RLN52892.1 hypothetical protein BBJ29_005326 [Phytophthora kernoviae]RLN69585.1 hypothetical protein BBP00_00000259 [Phytophthora kernoviae]RLN85802.1 hypothetical protein BBO99_00000176 [Phytophthora kernoviae]
MAMSTAEEAKISANLLQAIQYDEGARVDITVQLASTAQVLEESCGRDDSAESVDRGQRVACIVGSLQTFAEQMQHPVKELLEEHTDQFDSVMFLWIDNSVAVKGVHPELCSPN